MEREELCELGLHNLLLLENDGLIGQNCAHVSTQGLHVLSNEDSVLLGLIPEYVETLSKGEHRVLEVG